MKYTLLVVGRGIGRANQPLLVAEIDLEVEPCHGSMVYMHKDLLVEVARVVQRPNQNTGIRRGFETPSLLLLGSRPADGREISGGEARLLATHLLTFDAETCQLRERGFKPAGEWPGFLSAWPILKEFAGA